MIYFISRRNMSVWATRVGVGCRDQLRERGANCFGHVSEAFKIESFERCLSQPRLDVNLAQLSSILYRCISTWRLTHPMHAAGTGVSYKLWQEHV